MVTETNRANKAYFFDPEPSPEALITLRESASALGYDLRVSDREYSLGEIQRTLLEVGPSEFLRISALTEEIVAKAPQAEVEQRIAKRLGNLHPISELIVTDPYLYTSRRGEDPDEYANSVASVFRDLLCPNLTIITVVSKKATGKAVKASVESALRQQQPTLRIESVCSDDFHDRFWIADRERGVILGTSLNKIGRKIFFIDELSPSDVRDVVAEFDRIAPRDFA